MNTVYWINLGILFVVLVSLLLGIRITTAKTDREATNYMVAFMWIVASTVSLIILLDLFGWTNGLAAAEKTHSPDGNSLQNINEDLPPVAPFLDKASIQSQVEGASK